jgi:16S rRNA processing protein RimM
MTTPRKPPEYLILGYVLRPHGVRGELRVSAMTDYPERVAKLKQVYFSRNPENPTDVKAYPVESARLHQNYILLKLKDIDDRDQADTFREYAVMVDMGNAVPLEKDEYYLYQLIGLTVKTADGMEIGKITDVFETGANDVYVVQNARHGEVLIPAHKETLVDIDVDAGVVIVNLPEGLLPS